MDINNLTLPQAPFDTVETTELFKDKKVILFGLPGAFTPTCSTKQLPGYEEMFHNGSNAGVFPLKNMGWSDKTEVSQTNINHNSTPLTKEEIEAATKKRNELLDNY